MRRETATSERGRGRPPIGKQVPVRFPEELRARIDAFAERNGEASFADAVRELVTRALILDQRRELARSRDRKTMPNEGE